MSIPGTYCRYHCANFVAYRILPLAITAPNWLVAAAFHPASIRDILGPRISTHILRTHMLLSRLNHKHTDRAREPRDPRPRLLSDSAACAQDLRTKDSSTVVPLGAKNLWAGVVCLGVLVHPKTNCQFRSVHTERCFRGADT